MVRNKYQQVTTFCFCCYSRPSKPVWQIADRADLVGNIIKSFIIAFKITYLESSKNRDGTNGLVSMAPSHFFILLTPPNKISTDAHAFRLTWMKSQFLFWNYFSLWSRARPSKVVKKVTSNLFWSQCGVYKWYLTMLKYRFLNSLFVVFMSPWTTGYISVSEEATTTFLMSKHFKEQCIKCNAQI
jgi:hypothetical protein